MVNNMFQEKIFTLPEEENIAINELAERFKSGELARREVIVLRAIVALILDLHFNDNENFTDLNFETLQKYIENNENFYMMLSPNIKDFRICRKV